MSQSKRISIVCFAFCFFAGAFARAQVTNGGFESGDLTGWTFVGTATASGTSSGQPPLEGNFQAVISTPAGAGTVSRTNLETFLELTSGTLLPLNGGPQDFGGGSAIKQIFTVQNGDVIKFLWDFIPNGSNANAGKNDSVFFTLHLQGVTSSSFTILDQTSNHPSGTPGGYMSFATAPLAAGTYLLGFAAYDSIGIGSDSQDPGLLIDRVEAVPEPSAWMLIACGGLVVFFLRARRQIA
jgi:hypothetical protein